MSFVSVMDDLLDDKTITNENHTSILVMKSFSNKGRARNLWVNAGRAMVCLLKT